MSHGRLEELLLVDQYWNHAFGPSMPFRVRDNVIEWSLEFCSLKVLRLLCLTSCGICSVVYIPR
jgi:hypothetical protein